MSATVERAVRPGGRAGPMVEMRASESIPRVLRLLVEDMGRTGHSLVVGPGLGSVVTYAFLRGELEARRQAGIDVTRTGVVVGFGAGFGAGVQLRSRLLTAADDRWIRLDRLTYRRERGSCFSRAAPPQRPKDIGTVTQVGADRQDFSLECGPAELTIPLQIVWDKGRPTLHVHEFHVSNDKDRGEKDMYLLSWALKIKMLKGRPLRVWPSEGPGTGYIVQENTHGADISVEAQISPAPVVAGIGGSITRTTYTKKELSLFVTGASLSRSRNEVTLIWDTQAWAHDKTVGFHTDTLLYRYLSGTSVPKGVSCALEKHKVGAAFVTASRLSMRENNYRIANFDVQLTAEFRVPRKIVGKYGGFAVLRYCSKPIPITFRYFDEKLSEASFRKLGAGISG